MPLPGVQSASTTITLLTGDTVTLSRAGNTHNYSVTASSVPRANGIAPPIDVTGQGKASGGLIGGLIAVPADAANLIAQGTLDSGLFDVAYRAENGLTTGPVPVVLHYSTKDSKSDVAKQAKALPASTFESTIAGTNDVVVRVDLAQASTFWRAVTATAKVDTSTPEGRVQIGQPFPALQLTGGLQALWLQGHRLGDQAAPRAGSPLYDVAETIKAPTDADNWCAPQQPLCFEANFMMLGVSGNGAGNYYHATSISCVEGNPCTSYRVHYSVPAGTYQVNGKVWFVKDSHFTNLEITYPQLTVAGPTSLDRDANTARQLVVDTPDPTETYSNGMMNYRGLPDGRYFGDLTFNPYGDQGWWELPTPPVTQGTFHLGQALLLGQPPVTMNVTSPQRMTLQATYSMYTTYPTDPRGSIRFSGDHTWPVVYVGEGNPDDYTGKDVTGKLVLIRARHYAYCLVYKDQIQLAKQNGAVGVLIDPTDPYQPTGSCLIPMYPSWWKQNHGDGMPVDLPYAEVPQSEAQTLIDLLGHGTVKVAVHGNGLTPYLYQTNTYQETRVPDSLQLSYGRNQFALGRDSYHSAEPGSLFKEWGAWRPDEHVVAGSAFDQQAMPVSLKEYSGPVTPDLVRLETVEQTTSAGTAVLQSFNTYPAPGDSSTTNWGSGPLAPGAVIASQSALDAQPGTWVGVNGQAFCSYCRQGDALYSSMYLMDGSSPQVHNGPWYFTDTHLYSGGQEITAAPVNGQPAFTLPAAAAKYRMTADGGNLHNEWSFVSSRPTTDQVPTGVTCIGTFFGDAAPCRADPLVFLRYDAGLSLDNTVAAPGRQPLTVTAYHQDPAAPAITGVTLWTSVDGGATWKRANLHRAGDGSYRTTLNLPAVAKTDGFVSLRAEATDADGNSIRQTIDHAITLTSRK
ncbi:hypothetical protein Raf01_73260 [Rugosimonospora africana]|uniref:PA domain-containing protein n=1 Tax=Rugosimonospora africana TaxID=556532 RepID=A0A8J3QZL7_9ACTN|nr:hypothetical protein Raf01_73260 [Rugosimonospora africana]